MNRLFALTALFLFLGLRCFMIVPHIEHVPPDVTAGIFWLKNRDPQHWRATASSSSTCSASIGLKVRKTARDSFRIGDGKCRP
jgi:hypothetical protein